MLPTSSTTKTMFCDQLFRQKMVFQNQKNRINLQTNSFAFCIFADEAMKSRIDILKGIHPGKIIGRDLKKRNLSQRSFAASIGEHSQTLNAVITGRRNLTVEMALKIEQAFGYEEGFLLLLQTYYEIAEYKNGQKSRAISGTPTIAGPCSGIPTSTHLTGDDTASRSLPASWSEVMMQKKRRSPDSTAPHSLPSKPILQNTHTV